MADTELLSTLDNIRLSVDDHDWWNTIPEAQQNHLNEGLNDIESGRVVQSREFWTRLKNG